MTDSPRFDRSSLYDHIWEIVGRRVGYGIDCDALTDHICDAVIEWVPKKGDFWLEESSGMLWVNKGWEVVTVEGFE